MSTPTSNITLIEIGGVILRFKDSRVVSNDKEAIYGGCYLTMIQPSISEENKYEPPQEISFYELPHGTANQGLTQLRDALTEVIDRVVVPKEPTSGV